MSAETRRTLIFGIDGGTWEILNPLLERGVMPHLERLRQQGAWGNLNSVIPVNSAAAWSTFLTGLAPEEHGVYDFLAWRPGTDKRTAVNATWLPRPTILDLLKDQGPILSIKVPLTYPPWAISGAMVSGLPTPDDESAFTYPEELAASLNSLIIKNSAGRSWEVDSTKREVILDQLDLAQQSLERLTNALLDHYPQARICCVVARDVDELQHFFWDALTAMLTEDAIAYLPRLEKYFARLDDFLGRMLNWMGNEGRVVLLSDHGFGRIEGIWHLNEWLRTKGFLTLKTPLETLKTRDQKPQNLRLSYALQRRLLRGLKRLHLRGEFLEKSLEKIKLKTYEQADLNGIEWEATTAYAGNVGEEWLPIYINLKGREPRGTVTPENYERVREDLRQTLLKTTLPRVKAVHRAEEVFRLDDSRRAAAPDLLIETATGGVQSDFSLNTPIIYERSKYRKACHRRQGMFLLHGPDVLTNREVESQGLLEAQLWDIPATILAWHQVPIPSYFRGRPLVNCLPSLQGKADRWDAPAAQAQREYLGAAEETGVREKLESLGYL